MKIKALLLMSFVAVFGMTACEIESPTQSTSMDDPLLAKGGNAGQTAFTSTAGTGGGDFIGYNETDDPDYGIYSYTLWAGKTNDAGTVVITNDDENLYVTYNTNSTADLGEVHVYVWTDESEIPSKRPAPGHADYVVENINADSYTVEIPMDISCGLEYYISTHAALIANDTQDDEPGTGSNEGETAYAAGTDSPEGFSNQKGAWWGYVTYTVECFYDISGTVYEDRDNSGDLEDGETGFGGITVSLVDSEGNEVGSATTDADGSYIFEHVPGGNDYTVVVMNDPEGDYMANENDGGYSVTDLSGDTTDVDFGFVPLYDLSGTVYNDGNDNADMDGSESGLEGLVVNLEDANGTVIASTTTGADGSYTFENVLGGEDYTVVVSDGPEGSTATENVGGYAIAGLSSDTTDIDFGYYTPADNSDGNNDYFPTWGQDISHVILVFTPAPAGDNDGYYTVKIDEWPDEADNDLDNSIDAIFAYLLANDENVTENNELLGASIKGGQQITSFYAYGSGTNESDPLPQGIGFGYDGTSANESPQSAIDIVYDYNVIF